MEIIVFLDNYHHKILCFLELTANQIFATAVMYFKIRLVFSAGEFKGQIVTKYTFTNAVLFGRNARIDEQRSFLYSAIERILEK